MNDLQTTKMLFEAACKVRELAYQPYSNFSVGAALLGVGGDVFVGCNVENAAYPLCICAEQVAIAKAVSEGCRSFQKIVIVATPMATPCGACRQVIGEFFSDDGVIVSIDANDFSKQICWTLNELLPNRFRFEDGTE